MRQFVYYDNNGEIKQVAKFADMIDPIHPENLNLLEVDRDLLDSDLISKYISNGEFLDKAPAPEGSFWYWQPDNTWAFDQEEFMAQVRQRRDLELSLCDWTQSLDSPYTEEKKAEWRTYRQQLRDLPSSITSEQSIESISWPTEPS